MYILSSTRKHPDVLSYGFHRRESRGPVAEGNHKQKTTTETINKINVLCHDGNHSQTNGGNHKKKNVFLPRRKP